MSVVYRKTNVVLNPVFNRDSFMQVYDRMIQNDVTMCWRAHIRPRPAIAAAIMAESLTCSMTFMTSKYVHVVLRTVARKKYQG